MFRGEPRTSDHLWRVADYEDWQRFMAHDAKNPSRHVGYQLILDYLHIHAERQPLSFAEVGIGNARDFAKCFKRLHDVGAIRYQGFDGSPDLVRFAHLTYPAYSFTQTDICDLKRHGLFDLIYARHVFEHASPETYRDWLTAFLQATQEFALISWFLAPQADAHFDYPGAWNNTYCRATVIALIESRGFSVQVRELTASDHIYELRR